MPTGAAIINSSKPRTSARIKAFSNEIVTQSLIDSVAHFPLELFMPYDCSFVDVKKKKMKTNQLNNTANNES